MADLLTPPYGYAIPGISLFSNPQGSAPVIGPRLSLGESDSATDVAPGTFGNVAATVTIDPAFPKPGRAYLLETANLEFTQTGGSSQFTIAAALIAWQAGPSIAGVWQMKIGVPVLTTLQPLFANVIAVEGSLLIRTDDILSLAAATGTTTPGPFTLRGQINALYNVPPESTPGSFTQTFQFIVRIIDGIYG